MRRSCLAIVTLYFVSAHAFNASRLTWDHFVFNVSDYYSEHEEWRQFFFLSQHSAVTLADGSMLMFGGRGVEQHTSHWAGSFTWPALWRGLHRLTLGIHAEHPEMQDIPWEDGWPCSRAYHTSAALANGTVMVFGGNPMADRTWFSELLRDLWRVDLGINCTPHWQEIRPADGDTWPPPLEGHSMVRMAEGSLLVFGGRQYRSSRRRNYFLSEELWRFIPDEVRWEKLTPGPPPRVGHAAVALPDGSMLVFGGYTGEYLSDVWKSKYLNDVWKFSFLGGLTTSSTASHAWELLELPAGAPRPLPRSGAAAAALPDGSMVVFGGLWNGRDELLWRFTPGVGGTVNEWEQITLVAGVSWPIWTNWFTAVLRPDGLILAGGGRRYDDDSPWHTLEVWRGSGFCEVCAPDEQANPSGSCIACQPGWHSSGGCSPTCRPTLASFISALGDPIVSTTGDDYGILSFSVLFYTWPRSMMGLIIDVLSVRLELDVAASSSVSTAARPSCNKWWRPSEAHFRMILTPEEVRQGPCALNEEINSEHVLRTGALSISLIAVYPDGEEQAVRQWVEAVRVPSSSPLLLPTQIQGLDVYLAGGNIQSSLVLFTTGSFDVEHLSYDFVNLDEGFEVFVRQTAVQVVQQSQSLELEVEKVWLSQSPDPLAEAVQDITDSMQSFNYSAGSLRFSVQLQVCEDCYLHVLSRVMTLRPYSIVEQVAVRVSSPANEQSTPVIFNLSPLAGLIIIGLLSCLIGGLHSGVQWLLCPAERTMSLFLFLEFLDVVLDWISLMGAYNSGDLDLEGGEWVVVAISLSSLGSTLVFIAESVCACCLVGACCKCRFPAGPFLFLHVIAEDAFQMLLYAVVTASNVSEGVATSGAIAFACAQAGLFVVGKFGEVLVDRIIHGTPEATDETWTERMPTMPTLFGKPIGVGH